MGLKSRRVSRRRRASFAPRHLHRPGIEILESRQLLSTLVLPSTGTDANGNELGGGHSDPHYTVIGPGIPGGGSAAVLSASSIYPGWVADDAHSAWVGWKDSGDTSPYGYYTYQLTFNMAGLDPSTASLSGLWAADQYGYVTLNGNTTSVSVADGNWDASAHPNLNNFTISSGFVSGTNTLDFVVDEPDGFDGLRTSNLVLSASPSTVYWTSMRAAPGPTPRIGALARCLTRMTMSSSMSPTRPPR